ncbi:MAG TPA: UDP-glucose 4-epimerase GalE [Polyangiaceae bacterium]|jgi:UDP-glucose 4-epimerase|nr:UDP-glucose 4-epimerase GalE [Polyangiaceae bacterium]
MASILVTGGAGYIGSHMVKTLIAAGREVVVLDDLSSGHEDAVHPKARFVHGDIRDRAKVAALVKEHRVTGVVHFAAKIQVGESMVKPRVYFQDNLVATLALLETLLDEGVGAFILSSTAAVYGDPEYTPIDEAHPKRPVNTYGESKLFIEHALRRYHDAYGLKYAALRYFNASGADPAAGLGERHDPETHLIPLVLDAAAGLRKDIGVFGDDWETRDGTCERDYIHVLDLADAHLAALGHLESGGGSGAYNLGTGRGTTVNEIIASVERVSGRPVPVVVRPRRDGDPAVLVASAKKALETFGWQAKRTSLDEIVGDAWAFHQRAR